MRTPKPYMNPYGAGIGLGLVLLAAFVLMGRGLGASGALSSFVTYGVNVITPTHAQWNAFYKNYLDTPNGSPLNDWLVYEIIGVLIGGLISGLTSGHIPGAELMSLTEVLNGGVKRNEHIVLYSQGGTHASQAWALLKTKQFDSVFTLLGGMNSWESEILFPVLNSDSTGTKLFELSICFGGTPQIISHTLKKKIQRKKILPLQQPQQPLRKEEEKLRTVC